VFTGMELMMCPNLAVSAEVMQHIVNVESGANPYAIGVVGGHLVRQPQNLGEALATVHMLDSKGYNYSLGVAQVNRANLGKYGLDSYEKAFQTCPNLSAGSNILAACYSNSGGNWGKAFSCYYSGNFTTGYRDGYVQKVYDSINRSAANAAGSNPSQVIPLQTERNILHGVAQNAPSTSFLPPGNATYRVAIRSTALDTVGAAAVSAVGAALARDSSEPSASQTQPPPATEAPAPVAATTPPSGITPNTNSAEADVFVPQVRGPNDPPPGSSESPSPQVAATANVQANTDKADLRLGNRDAAFVF
jgi:type IV secretion system protein VirB1